MKALPKYVKELCERKRKKAYGTLFSGDSGPADANLEGEHNNSDDENMARGAKDGNQNEN